METPKQLDDSSGHTNVSARATAFVVLPDDLPDTVSSTDSDRPAQPSRGLLRWNSSVAMLERPSPIVALMRLASSGDETDPRGSARATMNRGSSFRDSNIMRSRPAILRAVSSILTRASFVETFYCYVCYDDVPVTETVKLTSCGHRYCEACFRSYLTIKINEGHIQVLCFHPTDHTDPTSQKTCGAAVSSQQIESIVDAEVWAKLKRFRFKKQHKHARECPFCAFTQEYVGPSDPACVCRQCRKTFCFFHGNAHERGTCADYELRNAEAEALNRAMINELAKPCPGCTRDIEKNGGCNHMKCVACHTSFCWLCGAVVEDVLKPSHFDPTKPGSCSGKQFDRTATGHEWQNSYWWCFLLAVGYVVMLPWAVVFTPVQWCRSRELGLCATYRQVHYSAACCFAALVVMLLFFALALVFGVIKFAWPSSYEYDIISDT